MRGCHRRPGSSLALIGLLVWSVSCGSDATAPKPLPLRFVAGDSASDTALAKPVQALMVEVYGGTGTDASGFVVRFQSLPYDSTRSAEPSMYLAPLASNSFTTFAADTTDGSGHASILVQMGRHAGTGRIAVSVPELGVEDTATFTILPGAAARVSMMPPDTAVYVNGTVQLRAAVTDTYGNPRTDPVTYVVSTSSVSVAPNGLLTGRSIGRAMVIAQAQEMVDTGWVSVVPEGTIAAFRSSGGTPGIVMFNLDGSGYKWLAPAQEPGYGVAPYWFPSGTQIVFGSGGYSASRLYSVDLDGNVKRFIQPAVTGLDAEAWPASSRDGAWVYFSGQTSGYSFMLWRAHSDGSGAEQLSGLASYYVAWRPSVSPDGTRVAFVGDGGVIQVLDLTTDSVSAWGVSGQTPRWSPTGDRIAFAHIYGGPISVMNTDGTNIRTISDSSYSEGAFDWSPDGQWIIARGTRTLHVINVQSGLTLPLGFTAAFTQPTWRP